MVDGKADGMAAGVADITVAAAIRQPTSRIVRQFTMSSSCSTTSTIFQPLLFILIASHDGRSAFFGMAAKSPPWHQIQDMLPKTVSMAPGWVNFFGLLRWAKSAIASRAARSAILATESVLLPVRMDHYLSFYSPKRKGILDVLYRAVASPISPIVSSLVSS